MSSDKLGVGLIGCGDVAPAHAEAIAAAQRVTLVACADVVESSAKSLAERYAVPYMTTRPEELVARPEVEVVTIATPAFTHADLVELAARAGKAVICEKPLAAGLPDADRMIAACEQAGVPFATCFPLRYLPAAVWTRDLIRAGAIGELIEVRLRSLSEKKPSYWTGGFSGRTQTEWRKSKAASGGGVVITNMIHNIDLARFCTGLEVTRASAEAGTFCTEVEVEDMALACLRYENGAMGLVDASSCFFGGDPGWDVMFLGRRGQARFGFWNNVAEAFAVEATGELPTREWVRREFPPSGHPGSLTSFYDEFAEAARAGKQPPVTGQDGRKALEVVVAIYRAAEAGRPVTLPL
jgi:predicted dehydrogenase